MQSLRSLFLAALALLAAAGLSFAGWRDFLEGVRAKQRPQQRTAVAGVRGWNADAAASDVDGRDYAAVDKIIAQQPSASELSRFVKEGGLE
jgi:hypothetical protein